jgi:hypothetical protein
VAAVPPETASGLFRRHRGTRGSPAQPDRRVARGGPGRGRSVPGGRQAIGRSGHSSARIRSGIFRASLEAARGLSPDRGLVGDQAARCRHGRWAGSRRGPGDQGSRALRPPLFGPLGGLRVLHAQPQSFRPAVPGYLLRAETRIAPERMVLARGSFRRGGAAGEHLSVQTRQPYRDAVRDASSVRAVADGVLCLRRRPVATRSSRSAEAP